MGGALHPQQSRAMCAWLPKAASVPLGTSAHRTLGWNSDDLLRSLQADRARNRAHNPASATEHPVTEPEGPALLFSSRRQQHQNSTTPVSRDAKRSASTPKTNDTHSKSRKKQANP